MTSEPQNRLGRSEDIPVAVEFLVQFVIRVVLFIAALGFGVAALVGFIEHWPTAVSCVLLGFFVLTVVPAFSMKPGEGRVSFRCDPRGPVLRVSDKPPQEDKTE